MSQSPTLDRSDNESEPNEKSKVRTLTLPQVAQMRLAHIQELQADLLRIDRDRRSDERDLRKEKAQLRRDLLRGATIEPGPLQAYVRRTGRGKKARYIVIVK